MSKLTTKYIPRNPIKLIKFFRILGKNMPLSHKIKYFFSGLIKPLKIQYKEEDLK